SPLAFAGPKRVVPPAPRLEALPRIDAVLISHNHYDHLDLDSVTRLARQPGGAPRYFVPLGLQAWVRRQGIGDVVGPGGWRCPARTCRAAGCWARTSPAGPAGRCALHSFHSSPPAMPAIPGTLPTSGRGSADSASPPCRSAPTRRVGSCESCTWIRPRRCA